MWLYDFLPCWLWGWLEWLGLAGKKGRVVLLGLDNAGKTTLLGVLTTGRVRQHEPTGRPNTDTGRMAGLTLATVDLGGHRQARRVWAEYTINADGVVFLVDSSDTGRMGEAGQELRGLLEDPMLENTPIAVIANKMDRADAASWGDLVNMLGIYQQLETREKMKMFQASVVQGRGYAEAIQWMGTFL